ncbi:hypothetical protein B0O80DRAFT_471433 [Mortierella sp. GBAus27b]|nr:hypothetical protein BGX31_006080 [Mortierella sp. GBA43]KAI8345882.1 hypothetical protein B0O80DRAFT_471433 [Mortierella sp. GBAus27b]
MAIPNTISVLENPQLARSADSLESALAQFSKLTASHQHNTVASVLSSEGKGFDEWLALLAADESPVNKSPVLDNEVLGNTMVSSLFGNSSPSDLVSYGTQAFSAHDLGLDVVEQTLLPGLTTSRLQQAAAALNIPWSTELEEAVLEKTRKLPTHLSPMQDISQSLLSSVNKTNGVGKRGCEVELEETEEILAKRAKNTDAARRSRLKKVMKLEGLESKVAELEATNQRLNTRIAVLETEKNGFLIKEAEQNARIAQLEAKVMEARLTLKTRG